MSRRRETTERQRVLIVGRSLEHERVGGIVHVSRQLLDHVDGGRFEVCYLANGAGRGGVLGGANRLLTLPVDLARAWRRQSRFRPDVIHINTSLDWRSMLRDSCFLLLVRIRCRRVVWFIHGWQWKLARRLRSHGHPLRWFYGGVVRLARTVVVLSGSFASVLEEMGLPGDRIRVVPNPVDCSAFPRPSAATRPGEGDVWRLLFMARFVAEKGIYELIEAMPGLIAASDRPVELVVSGDGPERAGAERRCRELGVERAVVFPGYTTSDAKLRLFETSHLFVLPTRYGEGRPIVLLEAMAAGLPLVVTAAGGIGEFVRDPEHGVVLADGTPAEIERGVLTLLGDPERLAAVANGNREYARRHFDSSLFARTLEDIYRC